MAMKGLTYDPKSVLANSRLAGVKINAQGEVDASSQKDLIKQIGRLMASANSVRTEVQNREREYNQDKRKEQRELLAAAMNDPVLWGETGTVLAAQINETGVRQGFCRSLLITDSLSQGESPKIRVKQRDVTAVLATGPASVGTQFVRSKFMYPVEFSIVANLEIENREIAQDPGDILDEKLAEGQEAIMVQEDLVLKRAMDDTVGGANDLTTIVGALTPTILATIAEAVNGWGLPLGGALIANDYWKDISTNSNWVSQFDPVSQAEVLLSGRLGVLLGMPLTTDGFRPPEQKVLEEGEIYVFTTPEYLGAMTDRGGVVPTPLNGPVHGRSTRGWYMDELFSLMVANTRGVAKGLRS